MKPTTLENQIADQRFKISEPDRAFMEYLNDCNGYTNDVPGTYTGMGIKNNE